MKRLVSLFLSLCLNQVVAFAQTSDPKQTPPPNGSNPPLATSRPRVDTTPPLKASPRPDGFRQINSIMAVVEGRIITMEELKHRIKIPQTVAGIPEENMDIARSELRAMVQEQLTDLAAKRLKIIVDPKELDYYLEKEIRQSYGDETKLLKILSEEGLSLQDFRRDYERKIVEGRLMYRLGVIDVPDHLWDPDAPRSEFDLKVSPREMRQYYEKHPEEFTEKPRARLRQILLPFRDFPPEQATEQARAIHQRAIAGEDFAELAKKYSKDRYREQGGDRGWIFKDGPNEAYITNFAFTASIGAVSEAFPIEGGIIFFKIEERQEARRKEFHEVQDRIAFKLKQEKRSVIQDRLFQELAKDAEIWPPSLFGRRK